MSACSWLGTEDLQSQGGVHSPEVCLPGSGWEIAWLERVEHRARNWTRRQDPKHRSTSTEPSFSGANTRMMVYYWFQQGDRRMAWDFAQKLHLLVDSVRTGHVHGGIVRLTTLISANETEADAEARLQDMLAQMGGALPRFFPTY
jgi:EpsI family protein